MNDLKTLKDLRGYPEYVDYDGDSIIEMDDFHPTGTFVKADNLRQEAIRQAKTLMKEMEIEYIEFEDIKATTDWSDLIDVACHAKDSYYHAGYGILYWLVKFYNLTKKDLK